MCKKSGWGDSNCASVAKVELKIYSYSTVLFVSSMQHIAQACLHNGSKKTSPSGGSLHAQAFYLTQSAFSLAFLSR